MKGKLIIAVLICFSSVQGLTQNIIVRDKYDSGFFPIVSVLHAHFHLRQSKRSLASTQSS